MGSPHVSGPVAGPQHFFLGLCLPRPETEHLAQGSRQQALAAYNCDGKHGTGAERTLESDPSLATSDLWGNLEKRPLRLPPQFPMYKEQGIISKDESPPDVLLASNPGLTKLGAPGPHQPDFHLLPQCPAQCLAQKRQQYGTSCLGLCALAT